MLALVLGSALAAPLAAQVTLFRDAGFRGRAATFHGAVGDLRGTAIGNDRASSVDVAPGCTATLYRDTGFRGPAIVVDGPVDDLRRTALGNDRVSSVDVRCGRARGWGRSDHRSEWGERGRGRDRGGRWDEDRWDRGHDGRARERWRVGGVVLFRDAGFRAPRLETEYSIADLGRTPLGNDRLSSVAVPRGCTAVLYEHAGFRGRSLVLRHDVDDLRRTPLGNDRVSSVEVDCR